MKHNNFNSDDFKSFGKLNFNKGKKVDFNKMSPYEIINYYREKEVKSKFKIFNSNEKFFRRVCSITLSFVFIFTFYSMGSNARFAAHSDDILLSSAINVDVDTSKFPVEGFIDYVIAGDFYSLKELYLNNTSKGNENHVELSLVLDVLGDKTGSIKEINEVVQKVQKNLNIKTTQQDIDLLYKMVNINIINGDLDKARSILEQNRNSFSKDLLYKEKEIALMLLDGNVDGARSLYNTISLDNIENVKDMFIYSKLSIIFKNFEGSLRALDKIFSIEPDNLEILYVADIMKNYDLDELNRVLEYMISTSLYNHNLKIIKSSVNAFDLQKISTNIEDIDYAIMKNPTSIIARGVKIDLLLKSSRFDEALILINDIKGIEDKNITALTILAKYSYDTKNYNDALNYIKKIIKLDSNLVYIYDLLIEVLKNENKDINLDYFYLKMKSNDIMNTNIDKRFANMYASNIEEINKSVDLLNFSSELSLFESDINYRLAKIYIDQKQNDLAVDKLVKAIEVDKKPSYYRTLGVLYLNNGQNEEGIKNIREAYSLDEKDVLTLNNAAAYYANVDKDIQRAFSNIKAAYETLNDSYNEYEQFIIRENFFKLQSIYSEADGTVTGEVSGNLEYLY